MSLMASSGAIEGISQWLPTAYGAEYKHTQWGCRLHLKPTR